MERREIRFVAARGVLPARFYIVLITLAGLALSWAAAPPPVPQDVIQRMLDAARKEREQATKPVDPFPPGVMGQIIRDAMELAALEFRNAQASEKAGKIDLALEYYKKVFDRLEFAPDPDNPNQPTQVTGYIPKDLLRKYAEKYTALKIQAASEELQRKDYIDAMETIHELLSGLPTDQDIPDPDDPNKVLIFGVDEIAPYRARAANVLAQIEKAERANAAMSPSRDVTNQLAAVAEKKKEVKKLLVDGRIMFEAREYNLADQYFRDAIELDPGNDIAYNYLKIMLRYDLDLANKRRQQWFRDKVKEVNDKWTPPTRKRNLPVPNPYYLNKSGLGPQSSIGRTSIQQMLQDIRVPEIKPLDGLTMAEVIGLLDTAIRDADPAQMGVNFQVNPLIALADQDPGIAARQLRAAAGIAKPRLSPDGLPILQKVATPGSTAIPSPVLAPPDRIDARQIKISGLHTPLRGLNVLQVLDVICRSFDRPIKYEVTDAGVMFGHRPPVKTKYDNRKFNVNPNAFRQGLVVNPPRTGLMSPNRPHVIAPGSVPMPQSRPGVGAVYNLPNGGGMQYKASGGVLSNIGQAVQQDDRVYYGINPGGGGGAPGGGAPGGGGLNNTAAAQAVQQYLQGLGINVTQVVFNDRRGILLIRAPLADMALVEAAIEVLNATPPQVLIESKFMEIEFDDNQALGFDWFIGDSRLMGNRMLSSVGTAPSFIGQPTANNPSGFFPFPGTLQNDQFVPPQWTIQPRPTDGYLTSNFKQHGNPLLTITGILTDPQFRAVLTAMESQEGADVLTAPKIITVSGRPANISVQDQRDIVVGVQPNIQIGPFGGAAGGTMTPITVPMTFGPTLDVVPYVGADGFTIEMNLRPSFIEFMGYEDSSFEATAFAGGNVVSQPFASPRIRQRQLDVQCVVWDQQTLMMGGLISESVTTFKDKVPFLGDIPFIGGLFRGESVGHKKKNMAIFVTPKIIDPAGNPVNTPETLPYMRQFWPPDSAPSPQGLVP